MSERQSKRSPRFVEIAGRWRKFFIVMLFLSAFGYFMVQVDDFKRNSAYSDDTVTIRENPLGYSVYKNNKLEKTVFYPGHSGEEIVSFLSDNLVIKGDDVVKLLKSENGEGDVKALEGIGIRALEKKDDTQFIILYTNKKGNTYDYCFIVNDLFGKGERYCLNGLKDERQEFHFIEYFDNYLVSIAGNLYIYSTARGDIAGIITGDKPIKTLSGNSVGDIRVNYGDKADVIKYWLFKYYVLENIKSGTGLLKIAMNRLVQD